MLYFLGVTCLTNIRCMYKTAYIVPVYAVLIATSVICFIFPCIADGDNGYTVWIKDPAAILSGIIREAGLELDIEDLPAIKLLKKSKHGALFVSYVNRVSVKPIQVNGEEYALLGLPGPDKYSGEPGSPRIPYYSSPIAVPGDVRVELTIDNMEIENIPGSFMICPLQPPAPDIQGRGSTPFSINRTVYSRDKYLNQDNVVSVEDDVMVRGKRYIYVSYNPILYNPRQQSIKAAWHVRWRLKYHYE